MWALFFQLCAAAPPDSDGRPEHLRLFEVSRSAESTGDYELAYRACSAALMADPQGPRVPYCGRRLAWMDARRSGGGTLEALELFQSIRTGYAALGRDTARQQVLALEQREQLSPTLTSDVRLWLARDLLNHDVDPAAAAGHLEPLWQQRETLPRESAREVGLVLSKALAAAGDFDRSKQVESSLRKSDTLNSGSIAERYQTLQRRRVLGIVSAGSIALYSVLSAPAFFRGWPQLWGARPVGLVVVFVACAGAAILSHQWEPGSGASVIWIALGSCLIHVWTLAVLQPSRSNQGHGWVRLGAFFSTLGLGYLALYWTDTLMWVGL